MRENDKKCEETKEKKREKNKEPNFLLTGLAATVGRLGKLGRFPCCCGGGGAARPTLGGVGAGRPKGGETAPLDPE